MKEKELVATLSEIAGDEAIATVVARTVLASDMLALDNTYDAQLSYIPETEPNIPEAERRKYFRISAELTQVLYNQSNEPMDYPVKVDYFNLISPFVAPGGDVTFEEMEFRPVNEEKFQIAESRLISRTELLAAERKAYPNRLVLESYRIGAGERVLVRIKTTSYEPIERGEVSVFVFRKTVNMRMSITFPRGALDNFKVEHFFIHQSCQSPSGVVNCNFDSDTENGIVRAEIKGGILPLNGITVNWIHK